MMTYEQMKQIIIQCCDDYYNQNESNFSDAEFDSLKDEFAQKYPNDPLLKQIGAPVDNSHWEKAIHTIPMTSLNKVNTQEEFINWAKSIGDNMYCVNDKLDGISIACRFDHGKLISAITRGDGKVGEEIYRNVIKMKNIKCNNKIFSGTLRGEIVLKQKDFEDLNILLVSNGKKPMSNPRNAASGIAKRLDGDNAEYLTVLFYDCDSNFKTEEEKFQYIESLGFKTSFWNVVFIDEVLIIYKNFEDYLRKKSEYDIDGLVIRANSMYLQKKLGWFSNGNPVSLVAWKFGAMSGETTLLDIDWHNGNQQTISPVLVFETVNLGTNISRASLSNLDLFQQANLAKGDKIMISRANDVIPFFCGVSKKSGNQPFEYPKTCSSCGEKTVVKGKFLYCDNDDCVANVVGSLNKYVTKTNMLGLAESTLVKLNVAGLVETPVDLYRITAKDVLTLEGFASRSAQKVIDIINDKKEMTLPIFIGALNIAGFSESMTKLLVSDGYDTLEKIRNITKRELVNIKGIESKKADMFLDGIKKKSELIEDLLSVGIKIKQKEKVMAKKDAKLAGKSFCVTGALEMGKREEFITMVEDNGGVYKSSITKDLNFLVMNDTYSGTGKNLKASNLGVTIINENEFLNMLE